MIMRLPQLKCKRCGHLWIPRIENPIACPKCNSRCWNQDREEWHPLLKSRGNKPRRGNVVKCTNCGKEIYVRPSELKGKRYCSKECANKGLMEGKPLICKVCGKEYYRSPAQIKWRGSSYCSNKCKGEAITLFQSGKNNPNWKGGVSTENHRQRASKKWKVWRDAVFTRDNWTCKDCGARSMKGIKVKLYPHHIKPFAKYLELRFEVSNGLTLCEDCHRRHTSWQNLNKKKRVACAGKN